MSMNIDALREAECRKNCNVCWGEDGSKWPCAREAARQLVALAASEPEPQAQAGEPTLLAKDPLPEWAVEERAKKDAALKACVETLRRIAVLVPKDDAQVADAITQAEEAMK